ncbi:Uncharacterised protein [Chlamydia trachomatis]|nr:Uncharacterised protein [Chlamydia trachomatis]
MGDDFVVEHEGAIHVFIVYCHIARCLKCNMHLVALLHKPAHGSPHRHYCIVGAWAEDEHSLGIGGGTLWA